MDTNSSARSNRPDANEPSPQDDPGVAGDGNEPNDGDEPPDSPDSARPAGERRDPPTVDLGLDQVFDALRNQRRRLVVEFLVDRDGSATTGELADHVAAIENDTTVQGISADQRKRAYVGLYQSHIPKLAGMDVVEYDSESGDVRLGPNASRLYPYMPDVDVDDDRPWEFVYLGYALACLVILSSAVGLGIATGDESLLFAFAAVGFLCAIALGHAATRRR